MHTKYYIITAAAVILSFTGGFWLANSLNKSELATLQANQATLADGANKPPSPSDLELPDKEIQQKLKEAKDNPENFNFQKGLGLSLYRYAASKKDSDLLDEVEVLLKRAHGLNPDDYEVLVSLANVNFDIGQIKKDQNRTNAAREYYTKALKKNPKDANVITDLGYSYLESEDADPKKAAAHLEEAYLLDQRSERIIASLTFAYLKMNDSEKASGYLEKLKKVNPQNPDIAQMEAALKEGASK